MIEQVIRDHSHFTDTGKIEALRWQCLKSDAVIVKTDYGTGANEVTGITTYPVKIRDIARRSLTSPGHARRLCRLAQYLQAETVLEIGTSLGITASYLAMANPNARVVTLEGCPELSRIAMSHFNLLGIGNVELITGPFHFTLQAALENLKKVDLVYIDGNHCREAVLEYFDQCLGFMTNDAVMVFDDIRSSSGMEDAWRVIRKHRDVRVSLDFFLSGWVLFREELSRQHFRLRYI